MYKRSSEEETVVPAVCCDNGFLIKDNQQVEDDCQKKLVVKTSSNSSCETRGMMYSMIFISRPDTRTDYESVSLASKERTGKSSQDIEMVPVDTLLVSEVHADKGDVKEAVTKIKQQVRRTRGAFEDFFGEEFNPSYSLIVKHEVVDAEELAMKLKVDHDEKTALRIQFGTRATHAGFLSLYIAQSADLGQRLLQLRSVSFYSRSDLSMMMEEAWKRFNRRTLTSRVSKLSGLTWNLAEGSTRTQKKMMNGSAYIRDPPVVKRKDDLEKRAEYVLKRIWSIRVRRRATRMVLYM